MELIRFTHNLKNDTWEKSFDEKAEVDLDCFAGIAITSEDEKYFICGKYGSVNKGFFPVDNSIFVCTNSCFCKNCVATVFCKKEERYNWLSYYGALPIMFEMEKDYFGHNIRMHIQYIDVHISIDMEEHKNVDSWYRIHNDNKNLKPKTITLTFKNNGNIIAEPAMTYKDMVNLFNHEEFFPKEIIKELKDYFPEESFWRECRIFDFLLNYEKFDCFEYLESYRGYNHQLEKNEIFIKNEYLFGNLCKYFDVEPTKELEIYFKKNPRNVIIYKMISYFGFNDYSLLDDYIDDEEINKTFNIKKIAFAKKKKNFLLIGDLNQSLYKIRGEKINKIFLEVLKEIVEKKKEKLGEKEAFNQLIHSKVNTKNLCYYYYAAKKVDCKEVIEKIINEELHDDTFLNSVSSHFSNVELKRPTDCIYFNDIRIEFLKNESEAQKFKNMYILSEDIVVNLMGYAYIFVVYDKMDYIGYVITNLESITARPDNYGSQNVSWATKCKETTFLETLTRKVLEKYPYENKKTIVKKEENNFSKIINTLRTIKNALFC